MLSIITACSREENLDEIYKSMDFKLLNKWYIIYDTSKNRNYTFKYKDNSKIIELNYNKKGVCGHPQINYALSLIKDGFVYIMDDDNIVHSEFWKLLPDLKEDTIYTWNQNRINENRILKGGIIKLNHIDTSQFLVPRKYIGEIQWDNYKRGADFKFINEIYLKHSTKFKYINKIACYHNYLKKKIAICFWGLMRSLEWTLPSIKKHIFKPLNDANIQFDVFIHTYKINEEYSNPRALEYKIKLNNNDYKLLNPTEYLIEDQSKRDKQIGFSKYLTKGSLWKEEDAYKNHIRSLWSLKEVTSLWSKSKSNYTHIIYCRPDVKYIIPLELKWFNYSDNVYIPNFNRFGARKIKMNDRFIIARPEQALVYGNRFKDLLEFSKHNKLDSETFLADILSKYKIHPEFIRFGFIRVRANGKYNEQFDVKELIKKKWYSRKMAKSHKVRRSRKHRGGNAMPLSYVKPSYAEPSAYSGSNVLHAQAGLARPVLNPSGGRRGAHTRRRGGFYPSVMGSLLHNGSRLIPAAGVTGYKMFKNYSKTRKNRK